jgi:hypothetical protein
MGTINRTAGFRNIERRDSTKFAAHIPIKANTTEPEPSSSEESKMRPIEEAIKR